MKIKQSSYPIFLFLLGLFSYFQSSAQQVGIRDSTDLTAFLDGVIEGNMDALDIAGVTVSVVKNNQLFFAKGYGYANVDKGETVSPSNTLFRIGSISKLFVWTAVMQLAEEGKVDLEADINQYLKHFQIPATYETPITLKHLMTHSAGFEEYVLNLFSIDTLPPPSLESVFMRELPSRVRPPGIFSSYSNHGTGIAAYIVEQVSGLKWDDYVEQKIFAPLNMKQTSFRQPLPADLKSKHAEGYTYTGGSYINHSFKTIPLAPVGVASTTAEDIVPFMLAHLQNGKYGNTQILDSITAVQMHSPLFQHAPNINGICYGFFDHTQNGHKIIGHGGATEYFFSMLLLYPGHDSGLFISTNTTGGMDLVYNVTDAFTNRYFPTTETPTSIDLSKEYLEQFTGDYLNNRRPHKRFTKIAALLSPTTKVSVTGEGNLKTSGNPARIWQPIDSLTFADRNSDRKMGFRKDKQGTIQHLFYSSSPHTALDRIPPRLSSSLNSQLFMFSLGGILLSFVLWLSNYFFKRYYTITDERDLPTSAKRLALFNGLAIILFFIAFAVFSNDNAIVFRKRNWTDYALLCLPLISLILTIWQVVKAVGIWKLTQVRLRSRLFYTLLTLGFIILMGQFYFWNLLGFHLY